MPKNFPASYLASLISLAFNPSFAHCDILRTAARLHSDLENSLSRW